MKKYIFALTFGALSLLPLLASAALGDPANPLGNTNLGNINFQNGTYSGAPASTAQAGRCSTPNDITTLFDYVLCLIVIFVTPFLFGVGGLIFIIGVLTYVRAGDDAEKRGAGRDLMWFGIIALFVMLSVWGFVRILTRSFFGTDPSFQSLPPRATSVFKQ